MALNRGGTRPVRVRIRVTHPALYRSIMVLSLMSVALAVNFWRSNPTFNPLGIPKNLIGLVFAVLGVYQFIVLNVFHNLARVRLGLAMSLGFILFWGSINTLQFFAGNASLQLPILYIALAAIHYPLLIEAPVNPVEQRGE